MRNKEIAAIFERLADLLEIQGADTFRVRAYRNAAQEIAARSKPMAELLAEGEDLSRLPGIGKGIAQKIRTIVDTGRLPQLEEAEMRVPGALVELMRIPGVGPKRVRALFEHLDIRSAGDLERALREHAVREVPGFGAKTEQLIADGLARLAITSTRIALADAEQIVAPLVEYLEALEGVKQVAVAGSYRRRRETVGDLDVLVSCKRGTDVTGAFVAYDAVGEVISHGNTRSTVRLRSGLQVDLRVVPEVSFGAALQYFTGSKAHNIAVRRIAGRKRLKLNEYGLFRGERRVAGRTEAEIYERLGLALPEPELREDRGEIEAAREDTLPRLVRLQDLRGDLHCHTRYSDGRNTLEQMARAAAERGHAYLAITDHSKRATIAHGMDRKRLARQIHAIEKLDDKLDGIVLLKGVEVDILKDGTLDLPDGILDELDIVVASVHYEPDLGRARQTERIVRAMDNPRVKVIAHPTGRLLGKREPYAVDLEALIEAAAERGCALELNAQPSRLDLNDEACRLARQGGAKVVISSDAHSTGGLANLRFGVDQARRAWLEPGDVLNTLPLAGLRKALRR